MSRALLIAVCALLGAGPAFAGDVSLRIDVSDSDGLVTLGDLFDGAGAASGVPVANRAGPTVVLDAAAVQGLARRSGLAWSNPQGLRRIVVRAGSSVTPVSNTRGNVEVLTWARSLNTGDVVQPQDLVWAKAAAAPTDTPRDAEVVIGMTARRPLREGGAVAMRDVSAQQVIKSGDLISVTWTQGGVSLTLQAKALANAAVGQTFNAQNPASKKIIEAVATAPGQAVTGPDALRLRAAAQYAAR